MDYPGSPILLGRHLTSLHKPPEDQATQKLPHQSVTSDSTVQSACAPVSNLGVVAPLHDSPLEHVWKGLHSFRTSSRVGRVVWLLLSQDNPRFAATSSTNGQPPTMIRSRRRLRTAMASAEALTKCGLCLQPT